MQAVWDLSKTEKDISNPPVAIQPSGADSSRMSLSATWGQSGRKQRNTQDQGTVPLQFLAIDEPFLPPNQSRHRQTVRRHVMRDFHSRRRKKERPLPVAKCRVLQRRSLETELEASASGSEKPLSGSFDDADYDHDRVQIAVSEVASVALNSELSTHDKARTKLHSQGDGGTADDGENPVLIIMSEPGSPADVVSGSRVTQASFLFKFDEFLFDTTTPYALFQADGAPTLCMQSKTWPFPQPLGSLGPKMSIWMPQVSLAPLNLRAPRACMHKTARVLPYIENSPEFFLFKIDTIRWINSRIADLVLSISDSTIGSIMLLTYFEASRGNITESVKHMDGLERIVKLRGGIDAFLGVRYHIQMKLSLLDLIVAIISNGRPRFPVLWSTQPTIPPPDLIQFKNFDSPLVGPCAFQALPWEPGLCQESISILQRLRNLTIAPSTNDGHTANPGFDFNVLTNTENSRMPYQSAPSVLNVIRLVSTIYSGALTTPPTPFSSPLNKKLVEDLCRAIESPINDDTWDQFPGIFVWILLVGSAAAANMPEHSFFVSILSKVGLGAAFGWWEEMSEAMRIFNKVKNRAERK